MKEDVFTVNTRSRLEKEIDSLEKYKMRYKEVEVRCES